MDGTLDIIEAKHFAHELSTQPIIFQDLLNAGIELPKVEEFSDHLRTMGRSVITAPQLLDMRTDEQYGYLVQNTFQAAEQRLYREIFDRS